MPAGIYSLTINTALSMPGCPVCNVGEMAGERYLWFLIHEYVNDPTLRLHLQESWGFCPLHTHQLKVIEKQQYNNDLLGNAILLQWLLSTAISRSQSVLEEITAGQKVNGVFGKTRKPKSPASGFKRTRMCPACQVSKSSQEHNLKILVANLSNDEFLQKYRESEGLCLPHFVEALALEAEQKCLQILIEEQIKRMQKLVDCLTGYIDKHDYRNKEGYTTEEEQAVSRAVKMVAGNLPRGDRLRFRCQFY